MKNIIITHHDLDGCGCYIVLSRFFTIDQYFTIGYRKEDLVKAVNKITLMGDVDNLFITDYAISQDVYDLINIPGKVYIIDHHPQTIELKLRSKDKIHFSTEASATRLSLEFCKNLGIKADHLESLVDYIDQWDLHTFEGNKIPVFFNETFWNLGFHDFYEIFKAGLTKSNYDQLKVGMNNYEQKLKKAKLSENVYFSKKCCISFDVSDLFYLQEIYHETYDYYIASYNANKISIRSKKSNLEDFYKTYNNLCKDIIVSCGGHPGSGGILYNTAITYEILEQLVDVLENKLEVK